jgi:hypothetical protein
VFSGTELYVANPKSLPALPTASVANGHLPDDLPVNGIIAEHDQTGSARSHSRCQPQVNFRWTAGAEVDIREGDVVPIPDLGDVVTTTVVLGHLDAHAL